MWMLLGQCSTIASLPKKPQLHFLFTERVSVIPHIHKCCIGHYKKEEQPLLNPYTKPQKPRYLTSGFLQTLCCDIPFCKGWIRHLRNGWGKTKTSPSHSRFNSLPSAYALLLYKSNQPSIPFNRSEKNLNKNWWQLWYNRDRNIKDLQSLT